MTAPSEVRSGLALVTAAGAADLNTVAQAAAATGSPTETRAAIFAAAPLIVADYHPAAATLALDWFEELREAARPPHIYVPRAAPVADGDRIAATVARATSPLYEVEQRIADDFEAAVAESLAAMDAEIQKIIAEGFRETMTENTTADPDAVGWRRFARPGACKFCKMLADNGAIYRRETVRFAAHDDCHCVVGQSYDPDAPEASVMQYVASRRKRTEKQRATLRAFLNEHYPDAHG